MASTFPGPNRHKYQGFTLIELLVVIAIIAILAVVVVLTLNPAQLLAQSRDANRVSDIATLNSAISLYQTDQSGASTYSLGSTSTAYLSLPSSASNCSSLGMATSAYSYACSTSGNYRNVSSSGWLPINFQNISSGSPFGSLPVDPTNQSSSNLYYAYETNGNQYVLSSFMESQKYAKNMMTTGGIDPALYEIGSGASTLPDATRGLVGYWPLNEGGSGPAIDWSGSGNNGVWGGAQAGTSGYYSAGKTGQWAGVFDGSSTYMSANRSFSFGTSTFSVSLWLNLLGSSTNMTAVSEGAWGAGSRGWALSYWATAPGWGAAPGSVSFVDQIYDGGPYAFAQCPYSGYIDSWTNIVGVKNMAAQSMAIYLNGSLCQTNIMSNMQASSTNTYPTNIFVGKNSWSGGNFLAGEVNDLRVYDRALTAAEIQELYNAEK